MGPILPFSVERLIFRAKEQATNVQTWRTNRFPDQKTSPLTSMDRPQRWYKLDRLLKARRLPVARALTRGRGLKLIGAPGETFDLALHPRSLWIRSPPTDGIVRIIVITDKQFERMNVFHGKTRSATEPAPEQISFSETAIDTALDRPTAKHQNATNMVSFW